MVYKKTPQPHSRELFNQKVGPQHHLTRLSRQNIVSPHGSSTDPIKAKLHKDTSSEVDSSQVGVNNKSLPSLRSKISKRSSTIKTPYISYEQKFMEQVKKIGERREK